MRGGGAWSVDTAATVCWSVTKSVSVDSLVSATSLQFLRLCLRVGTEKKDRKPFVHFSRSFCELTLPLLRSPTSRSVKGWLWSAIHKEEEEEGRRGGRERRREASLSRLNGGTSAGTIMPMRA